MNLSSFLFKDPETETLKPGKSKGEWPNDQTCDFTTSSPHLHFENSIVIETSNVSLFYNNHQAIHNVTTTIPRNRITAIVGPSGCGKTSFLLTLNKIYEINKSIKVTGAIRYNGHNILQSGFDSRSHRKNVGMLFQKPNAFPLSVLRNLELPLLEHRIATKSEVEGQAEVLFKRVGLWNEIKDRLHKPAQELSGGQQQRLCLARALSLNPKVLLMDEPCSALDPHSTALIEDLLSQLRSQITIIIVTHNLAQAKRVSDHTLVFWSNLSGIGELVEQGTTEKIFTNPSSAEAKSYIQGLRG